MRIIVIVLLLMLSGCVGVQPEATPAPTPAPTPAATPEAPGAGVIIFKAPAAIEAGRSFEISWRVNSEVERNISHTAVHYGFESKSEPLTLQSYPNLTVPQGGIIPANFSASLVINRTGILYFRAHAIIDGAHYWSGERNAAISAPVTLSVKKSAHYVSNTPAHGSVLASVPENVSINFNFDLGTGSSISIKTGNREYGSGATIIESNKLVMRRSMDPNAPDGLYTVSYNACWPDGSCHDGHFQFTIDRTTGT